MYIRRITRHNYVTTLLHYDVVVRDVNDWLLLGSSTANIRALVVAYLQTQLEVFAIIFLHRRFYISFFYIDV